MEDRAGFLAALAALGDEVASEPRVFGSFAWEALTGLPYVTAVSDLALLSRGLAVISGYLRSAGAPRRRRPRSS